MSRKNMACWILAVVIFSSAVGAARAQSTPQRTLTSNPSSAPAPNPTPDPLEAVLRQYREMWQKMGPAQQKAFLDSGGSTPEQYERKLRSQAPAGTATGRQAPADPRDVVNALGSLNSSLQDLNAIRDGNLSRIQKDGCPPEVTSRLADLKGKLRQDEAQLAGAEVPAAAPPMAHGNTADAQSIADGWYKPAQTSQPEASRPDEAAGGNRQAKQLADVLPGATAAPAGGRRIEAVSAEAQQRQKALEEEIARLKAEIAQLSGACANPAK